MDFTPFGEMKYKGHDLFVLDIHKKGIVQYTGHFLEAVMNSV